MKRKAFEYDELAAAREGWHLFDCTGSENGTVQLCRIDDPEAWREGWGLNFTPPERASDDAAWIIVMTSTEPHHLAAQAIITAKNPKEWAAMLAFKEKSEQLTERPQGS